MNRSATNRKDMKQVGYITSTSNRELTSYNVQVLSVGFQGGHVTHASIVGRRREETNEGETFDVMRAGHYDVIFLYLEVYSHT